MIELNNVSFAYEGQENCIHNVNLTIRQGECVVLVGRSGNGKTTLTRIINGLAPAYYRGTLTGEVEKISGSIGTGSAPRRSVMYFKIQNRSFFLESLWAKWPLRVKIWDMGRRP